MRCVLFALMMLTTVRVASAQIVDTAWVRQFSSESVSAVGTTKMALDSFGNPILIGWITSGSSASDFMVLKFYSTGDTAWLRNFDLPEHGSDRANAISITAYPQVIAISGSCNQESLDSSYAATIVVSADGVPLDTVYHSTQSVVWNRIASWWPSLGSADLTVVGEASLYSGNLSMQRTFGWIIEYETELENIVPIAAVPSADKSTIYVAGRSGTAVSSTYTTAAVGASDLDTNWLRKESESAVATTMSPTAIAALGNDGAVVTGQYRSMTWTSAPFEFHWMTYRYNALGTRLWSDSYATCKGIPKSICTDDFGNTFIVGQAQADYACAQYVPDTNQILILKYDSGGELAWDLRYTAPGMTTHDVIVSVMDSQRNLYVAANVLGDVAGTNHDILVMRVNPDGEIDWTYMYASADGDRDLVSAMCLDQQANLYIAGTEGGNKVLLIKLVQNTIVDVDDPETPALPASFELSQNFPNPFNPSTEFWYSLAAPAHAIVEVIATSGAMVCELVDADLPSGSHRVIWDGTDNSGRRVASGVYLYRLRVAGQSVSKKMTLIK